MIVLDTNVLSELARPDPDAAVLAWVAAQRRPELCTTAISEAELAYGLALLPKGRRRDALAQATARLLGEGLGGRVLPFDRAAAAAYGEFVAKRRAAGRPVAAADAQIAATARARGASPPATRAASRGAACASSTLGAVEAFRRSRVRSAWGEVTTARPWSPCSRRSPRVAWPSSEGVQHITGVVHGPVLVASGSGPA